MILTISLLVAGFILLAKGGDFLVDGSSSIAKHFNVSELVIGLTVVSFGTSAPELLVNIMASFTGSTDIALGNVIGSNICNTLLILGAAGLITPIAVQRGTVWREIPFALFISIILALLLNNFFITDPGEGSLSRGDGIILLILFALFIYYIYKISVSGNDVGAAGIEEEGIKEAGLFKSVLLILIGLAGLIGGGRLVVTGAVEIATELGVSQALIGLTIVAVGTSLPELFASVMATYRGKPDIAIGNVVGSNIFNILLVLGISSTIKEIPYPGYMNIDLLVVVVSCFFVFAFMFFGKRHRIERVEAGLLVAAYAGYTLYLIGRG